MWSQIWKWKTRDSCLYLAMLMGKSRFFRHIKCIKWTSFHTKQELASVKNSVPARPHKLCKITGKNRAVFQTAQNGKSASAHHTNLLTVIIVWCNFVNLLELCYEKYFLSSYIVFQSGTNGLSCVSKYPCCFGFSQVRLLAPNMFVPVLNKR